MSDKTETAPLDLAALRRLCEGGFRRPWTMRRFEIDCPCPNGDDCGDSHDCVEVESREEYPASPEQPAEEGHGQCIVQISVPGLEEFAQANGELVVAAVNALPALLDRVERAEREGAELIRDAEARVQAMQHYLDEPGAALHSLCAWCGAPAGSAEERAAHNATCAASPSVRQAQAAESESARLRARLAEVEGAARALLVSGESIEPLFGMIVYPAARLDGLRAVLFRTEGRTPEVKL